MHRQRRAGLRAGRATADAAIVTEPTSGGIQHSQVGVLWFSVRVAGRPPMREMPPRDRTRSRPRSRSSRPARARGRAERGPARPLRRLPAPDQPQRRRDPRRRLAVHRGRREHHAFPPGPVSRHGSPEELKRACEEAVAAAVRRPRARRLRGRGLYDGFACRGYTLDTDAPLIGALAGAAERRPAARRPCSPPPPPPTRAQLPALRRHTGVCFGPHAESIHGVDERVSCPRWRRRPRCSACSSGIGAG